MSIDTTDLLPKAPDPAYVQVIAAVIRGLIQVSSGIGFAWGATLSDGQVVMYASAIVMIATLIWSAYQKIRALRHSRQSAMASAIRSSQATMQSGEPTPIAVTNHAEAKATVQALIQS